MSVSDARRAIVSSRLLIVQSKRLMLTSVTRRHGHVPTTDLAGAMARHEAQLEKAQALYNDAILDFSSPELAEYWLVAYARLLTVGRELSNKLRESMTEMPVSERFEVTTDIESLDEILERWTDSMRRTMTAAVA